MINLDQLLQGFYIRNVTAGPINGRPSWQHETYPVAIWFDNSSETWRVGEYQDIGLNLTRSNEGFLRSTTFPDSSAQRCVLHIYFPEDLLLL